MNNEDTCANCGKTYQKHLLWDGNKCSLGNINGWFPRRLAEACKATGLDTFKDMEIAEPEAV